MAIQRIDRKANFLELPSISMDDLHKIAQQMNKDEYVDFVCCLICEMDEEQIEKIKAHLAD